MVLNALREWKLACPKGELDLVFPNRYGGVASLLNIVQKGWSPVQIPAKVTDENGKVKYRGMHALRHFYASWCINRRADGGLELPLKVVQARLGHASIQMTADIYGHLFPRGGMGEASGGEWCRSWQADYCAHCAPPSLDFFRSLAPRLPVRM
jgi:integrase